MITEKLIQRKFVETVLTKYGQQIEDAIKQGIAGNRYNGSGTLINSVDNIVSSDPDYFNGILQIAMDIRGRYLDIRATHKHLWKTENPATNKKRYNKTKREGFYSRNAYGSVGSIVYSLLYYLTEDTKEGIRELLTEGNAA